MTEDQTAKKAKNKTTEHGRSYSKRKKLAVVGILVLLACIISVSVFGSNTKNKAVVKTGNKNSEQVDKLIALDNEQIKAAQTNRDKAEAYTSLANLETIKGDHTASLKAHLAADKVEPNNIDTLSSIGHEYFLKHDKKNTLRYFTKTIALVKANPDSPYKDNIVLWQGYIDNATANTFKEPMLKDGP